MERGNTGEIQRKYRYFQLIMMVEKFEEHLTKISVTEFNHTVLRSEKVTKNTQKVSVEPSLEDRRKI